MTTLVPNGTAPTDATPTGDTPTDATPTGDTPTGAPPAAPPPQRVDPVTTGPAGRGPRGRIQVRSVTGAMVLTLLGAALGALGMTWVLFERVLPLSGDLGFWVCAYVVFLGMYAAIGSVQWPRQVVVDRVVALVLSSAGLLVLAVVAAQIYYTTFRGWDAVTHPNFFTQSMALAGPLDGLKVGGMVNALVGSLEQLGLASAISVPLGVFAALFLVEVGGPLSRPVRTIVEAMTALPEIIAGLFVYAFVILALGLQASGLAAAIALAVTMIPIVTRASEVVLRLVPHGLREASYALGASQVRTVFTVLLPTARSGLATAVILAMARAVGETSPVLLTAGFTSEVNANPLSGPQTSLPLYIFTYVREPQQTMVARAFGAALALMIMVLALFALARAVGGRPPGQLSRRQQRRIRRSAAATGTRRAPKRGRTTIGDTSNA